MRVSQIMTSNVITIDKNLSLTNAIDIMQRNEISRLVVTDAKKIVGVMTEKDIMRELGSSKTGRLLPEHIHVSNLMTANPITVAPEVMAKRAAEIMLEHDISCLPVVAGGELLGIATKLDFAKVCMDFDDIFAGQVMQASPITVSPGDRAIHARKLLLEEDLVGLPVHRGRLARGRRHNQKSGDEARSLPGGGAGPLQERAHPQPAGRRHHDAARGEHAKRTKSWPTWHVLCLKSVSRACQ